MKKVILLVLFLVIFLNGCYYQPELRPKPNSPEIWICEEPYAELYWTDDGDSGKIVACGKVYDVAFIESYSVIVVQSYQAAVGLIYDKYNKSFNISSRCCYSCNRCL